MKNLSPEDEFLIVAAVVAAFAWGVVLGMFVGSPF